MSFEKEASCLWVGCNALKEGQGITDSIGGVCCERGGLEHGVNGDYFLKESSHGAKTVPEVWSEFWEGFSLFAEFEECCFFRCRVCEVEDELFHGGGNLI